MFKNWKTTASGCLGLPVLIEGISTKDWGKAAYGIGLLLVGFFSKDNTPKD